MSPPPPLSRGRPALPPGLDFWHPAALISTWFGSGLLPVAPGTWGSLAALPIAWLLALRLGPWAVAAAGVLLFILGLVAVKSYLARAREEDPRAVVIDEVSGQLLAVAPAGLDPVAFALGFILFRIFDVMKPWPLGAIERGLPGAMGVMADDTGAALYTSICLALFFLLTERTNVFF
ncbi:MAG TPA: phosphatidylglycerophosphatase A [Alphaproteobacteria bacterium]|nr:phosphatidylglycerophosphatase A [Alphaproteobacteria bacterium]